MGKEGFFILLLVMVTFVVGQCLPNVGPTIVSNNKFDTVIYAEKLNEALKEKYPNHPTAEVICSINNEQRQEMAKIFLKNYTEKTIQKELEIFIKTPTSPFFRLMLALMTEPIHYDAQQIHEWDYVAVTEILATRTKEEKVELERVYKEMYQIGIEDAIRGKKGPPFLISLYKNGPSHVGANGMDEGKLKEKADELVKNIRGFKKHFTNSAKWVGELDELFSTLSKEQLRQFFDLYKEANMNCRAAIKENKEKENNETKVGKNEEKEKDYNDIKADIKKAFGFKFSKYCYLEFVDYIRNDKMYFPFKLRRSLNDFYASNYYHELIRVIVSRSEIDLADIKQSYDNHFVGKNLEKSINEAVDDEYSTFKKALLKLVKGNVQPLTTTNDGVDGEKVTTRK